ncbi:phage tail tape measure protein [Planomicrobium okeanokoites]|uniref:Phage tail tape measure protein n=1 Tax=Planomicrobium okeanokoites TaxID=244 RepID=A0ABV7KTG6_PLAOK|nr:phage tail tape measure protein [Planomicrobium okeanokoites]TAA71591.1 phage tail tape measure protein [Planomicrobium okeanokoites]
MAESYSVEAFLKADHTGFVRGFQVAAQAARDFQRDVSNMDTSGIENAGKQFEKVGDKIQTQGKNIAKTGGIITAAITLPILGAATAAIQTGMDFEASMSNVQAISGATGEDLVSLEKKAREMGATTSKSAGEAADAMSYMALAGWDTTQIMQGIEPILRLSEAGSLDLATASDLVTDSMSALGLEVKDLPGYLDQVAQTSRKANTDIDSLMQANLAVGGSFNNLNVPLAEGNALLGIMANRGIKGAEAGNALSSILVNMTSGAGQAGKAMEELGISAFDSEGNFKGVENVLQEVSDATAGLSEEQRTQYLSMIAGKTQLSGFQALLDGLGKEYGDLKGNVENSNGALNEMAATMQNNLKGKLTEIGSALSEVGIKIYQALLPYLQKAAEFFLNLVNKVNALSPQMQMLAGVVAIVAAAIGPLLLVLGGLVTFVGMVVSNFGILLQRFAPIIARHAALKTAVGLLGRAFSLLFGPIGLIIGILLSLVPVFIKLYQENEKFRAIVDTVWNFIKTTIETVVAAVVAFVMSVWGQLVAFWNENGEMIKEATSNVWNVISTVIQGVLKAIQAVFQVVWPIIQIIVMSVWENIKGVISGALDIIMGLVQVFAGLFTGNWSAMWEGVKQMFSGAVQFLWNAVQLLLWGKLLKGLAGFVGAFRSQIGAFWNGVKTLFNTSINAIKSFFTAGLQSIRGVTQANLSNILNFFRTIFSAIVTTVRTRFANVVTAIRTALSTALTLIRTVLTNMINAVKNKASAFLSAGKDLIRGLINGIKNMTGQALSAITGVVDSVVGKAKSLFGIKSPSRVFMGIGAYLSEGLANGIDDKARTAIKTVGDLSRSVTNAFNPELAVDGMNYNSQIRNLNGQMKQQMTNHVKGEMSVNRQPVIVNIYDNKEAVRAYVNEENAVDAQIRRF